MSNRLWASLDDFGMPDRQSVHVGLNYANHYFMRALFRYSRFDAWHFFLTNASHCRSFETHWGPVLEKLGVAGRVHLFDRLQLADNMKRYDYQVFHLGDQLRWYGPLCRLRNQLGVPVPVTAFIHSLSGQQGMDKYLSMLADGPTAQDAIICSSQAGKLVIEKRWEGITRCCPHLQCPIPLPVIPLGIDEAAHATDVATDRATARQQFGFGPQEVVGLCFGRFSDTDKMDLFPLLQSFEGVARQSPRHRLVIAGALNQKSYYDMVRQWAATLGLADQVTLFTDISETDKHRLFAAVDIFISIADNPQETFGLTLLEAMYHGRPLIVSDFNGYKELVPPQAGIRIATCWAPLDELGQLHPVCDEAMFHRFLGQSIAVDVKELKAALLLLYRSEALREKMGRAARQQFEEKFAHHHIIARLEALWAELKHQMLPRRRSQPPLYIPDTQAFSHYVTHQLQDTDQVQATAFSTRLAKLGQSYPKTFWMEGLLDDQVIAVLLEKAQQPVTLGDLLNGLSGYPPWRVRYLVLWMLKHDLLERK